MKKGREGGGIEGGFPKNSRRKRNDIGEKEQESKKKTERKPPSFRKEELKKTDLKWGFFPRKSRERNLFPGFQKSFMFLLPADGELFPKLFPGIQELGNHMSHLNEQIVVFHSLPITAEEMLQEKAVILLGIKSVVLNGPSSSGVNQ